MRKQWVAMLSMLGLAGPAVRAQSPVAKGSQQAVTNENRRAPAPTGRTQPQAAPPNQGKLQVNQQRLRTQNPGAGKQGDPLTPSAYCNARKQGATPDRAVTKGDAAVTKGDRAVTKGDRAVTKGDRSVTKGDRAVTKGDAAVTKAGRENPTKAPRRPDAVKGITK